MIREYKNSDLQEINFLLTEFQYQISNNTNEFQKILVYYDNGIKGVLVYDFIYDRIEIEYIIVDKLFRKNGIATKLIKYMEENNIANNITLEVRESNKTAINFYEHLGFKKVSKRKNYYKQEDGILMIKK